MPFLDTCQCLAFHQAPTRGFLPTDALFALLRPPLVVLKTLFSWLSDAFCLALHGYVPGSGAERKMKAPLKFKVRGASARNALERLKRRLRKTGTKRRMAFSLRRRHKTKVRRHRVLCVLSVYKYGVLADAPSRNRLIFL